MDSEAGTVAISPTEETEDPLSVWKARYIVKAIGRGFNPEISFKLMGDETNSRNNKPSRLCWKIKKGNIETKS